MEKPKLSLVFDADAQKSTASAYAGASAAAGLQMELPIDAQSGMDAASAGVAKLAVGEESSDGECEDEI